MNVKRACFLLILALLYLWVAVLMYGVSLKEYSPFLPLYMVVVTCMLILLLWGWNDWFVRNRMVGLWMLGASFLVMAFWIVDIVWENCPLLVELIIPVLLTIILVVGVKYRSKKENTALAPLGSQWQDWLKLVFAIGAALLCYAFPLFVLHS